MAEELIIETADVRKSYGSVQALVGLDLRVPRGAVCGLLGRNGAGKTTTIKVLLGMVRPTSGTARVFGLSAGDERASVEIRGRTAFVSEDKDLYGGMTVGELIRFTAPFYPKWRADLASGHLSQLELRADARVNDLSRGTRTKLALLIALSTGAELLILDEPTSGLDPAATEQVLKILVKQAGRDGTTVLFSSHHLADVEQVADRIAIVDRGRVAVDGALDEVRARYKRIQLVFDGDAPDAAFKARGVVATRKQGRVLSVLASDGERGVVAEARALQPKAVDVLPVTLKEIFLETVGVEN
ncbi:MAG TPA: ABC transporter ATP-binding protein [Gammaproteobacteria bacterium]|nr:ABC transporter ATP-binding protein [Gammaproteobacteria bacterium]